MKRDIENVWALTDYLSSIDEYASYKTYYYFKANIPPRKNVILICNGLYVLWNQLRDNYIFYYYRDIKVFKPVRNQIIVDTMHGSPLKNIGYLASNFRLKKLWKFQNFFSYILCVSDFLKIL